MAEEYEYVTGKFGGRRLIKRVCENCGEQFGALPGNVKKGMGKYCSATCARRGRGDKPPIDRICKKCGSLFKTFASRIHLERGFYCSQKCYWDDMKETLSPRACGHCKKIAMVLPYRQRRKSFFCSKVCRAEGNKTGGYVTCENPECGASIYRPKNRLIGRKHSFCSMRCRSAVVHGENHHLWEGGTNRHYKRSGHNFSHYQRRLILERDDYTCQDCGDDQADVLHVDHILAVCLGGTRKIENGQTLCSGCHSKKTTKDRAELRKRKDEQFMKVAELEILDHKIAA